VSFDKANLNCRKASHNVTLAIRKNELILQGCNKKLFLLKKRTLAASFLFAFYALNFSVDEKSFELKTKPNPSMVEPSWLLGI
jgi:hypothetical protein